jgi:hypothetical protein
MVKGMDLFRERFRGFEDSFILIGGSACDEWFASFGQRFRATKYLDIVLIIETMDPTFLAELGSFIADGGYIIRERTEGIPALYRFARPARSDFPEVLEFFCRQPEGLALAEGQRIIPFPSDTDYRSLSAILLDEDYYALVRRYREIREGIPVASVTALIPLKASAWSNLTASVVSGEQVDSRDITKHRNDIFRLAGILTGASVELAPSIVSELSRFLRTFPEDSPEWPGILTAIRPTLGGGITPSDLISTIQSYYRLPA